jgi:hypothetical protein
MATPGKKLAKWQIRFQLREKGQSRPNPGAENDEGIVLDENSFGLPNVGDTVQYFCEDRVVLRKVISRHFNIEAHPKLPDKVFVSVNIVVEEASQEEISARINK